MQINAHLRIYNSHCCFQAYTVMEESVDILGEDVTAPVDILNRQKICKELMKSL